VRGGQKKGDVVVDAGERLLAAVALVRCLGCKNCKAAVHTAEHALTTEYERTTGYERTRSMRREYIGAASLVSLQEPGSLYTTNNT
jgi:prophage antirepressor-like protein